MYQAYRHGVAVPKVDMIPQFLLEQERLHEVSCLHAYLAFPPLLHSTETGDCRHILSRTYESADTLR